MCCGQEGLVAITGEVISPHDGLRLYNCTWLKRQGPMAWQPLSRCLTIGWEQLDPCCFCRHCGTAIFPPPLLFILSFLNYLRFNYFVSSTSSLPPLRVVVVFCSYRKPQHEQRKEQEPKRPHIKKPLNAFMLYMKEMRANVVAECTLKESAAINQILGRRVGHSLCTPIHRSTSRCSSSLIE